MSAVDTPASAIDRIKKRSDFLRARTGPSERRKSLVVQAHQRRDNGAVRAGFTATKKIGTAPTRNRAKRRLREAASMLLPLEGVAGTDYVFIARQNTASIEWPRLLDDMKTALISLAPRLAPASTPIAPDTSES